MELGPVSGRLASRAAEGVIRLEAVFSTGFRLGGAHRGRSSNAQSHFQARGLALQIDGYGMVILRWVCRGNMAQTVEPIPLLPEANAAREAVFRAALERVGSMRPADYLRAWIGRELRHELYQAPAKAIRDVPSGEPIPSSLLPVTLQYFVLLSAEGANLFAEEARTGPNLLGAGSPLQGVLAPAVVRAKGPSGDAKSLVGALLVPGFVPIPVHVSRVPGAPEVLVCFGISSFMSSLTCAYYDPSADVLMIDVVR